jgi:hypothetical protein
MTPVERVGEALSAKCMALFGSTWSIDVRRELARAAIEAMREPTEAMVDAARAEMLMDPVRSANVFHVMIDAALNEKPTPG